MIAQGSSASVEFVETPLLMLGFPLSEDALLIRLAGGEQMIEDASQLVGGRGDGFWGTEFGAHAPVVVAKRRLVVMQGMGRNT